APSGAGLAYHHTHGTWRNGVRPSLNLEMAVGQPRLSRHSTRWRRHSSLRARARVAVAPCQYTPWQPAQGCPTAVSRIIGRMNAALPTFQAPQSTHHIQALARLGVQRRYRRGALLIQEGET